MILICGSIHAQVIDTLNTRAEIQLFPVHEPGFDIDQSDGTLYYGGTTGLYYSSDGGDTWSFNPFLVNGNERSIHHIEINQNTGRVYVASTSGGIGFTDDQGASWTILNSSSAKALYIDENNVCYASVGALFRWVDGDWVNRVNLGIQADKVTPGNNNLLYAVSEGNDKIYYSIDDGVSWEIGIDANDEAKFIIPKANNEVIYSIWGEGLFEAPEDLSSAGENFGGTFLDGIKLENGFMWLIASNTTWLISSDDGENFDTYSGSSTTELLDGVEPPSIDADGIRDQLDTYNGKIYLAETQGRIYTLSPISSGIKDVQTYEYSMSLYPNPVLRGQCFKIESEGIPERIELYNQLGHLVQTSMFKSSIPTNGLTSGIYHVVLIYENQVISKKLIIK